MPRSGLVQRADGPNPYAFGTSVISPASAGATPDASRDRSGGTLAQKYAPQLLPSRKHRHRLAHRHFEHSAYLPTGADESVLWHSLS